MAISVDTDKISSRLKELKKIKNLKQDDLMNVTGTSRATISNYEQGKVKPPVEFLMKISKAYNISLDWLCGLSDTANGVEYTTYADLWECINKLKEVINFNICITNITDDKTHSLQTGDLTDDGNGVIAYSAQREPAPACICFDDEILHNLFIDYKGMEKIYKKGIITEEIFKTWINGKTVELSEISLPEYFPF